MIKKPNHKKAELSTTYLVIIAVVVIVLFDIGGAGTWVKGQLGINATTTSSHRTCYIEDTTLDLSTVSYTSISVNGVNKGGGLDTLIVQPADKIAIISEGTEHTFSIPCVGEVSAAEVPDFTLPPRQDSATPICQQGVYDASIGKCVITPGTATPEPIHQTRAEPSPPVMPPAGTQESPIVGLLWFLAALGIAIIIAGYAYLHYRKSKEVEEIK